MYEIGDSLNIYEVLDKLEIKYEEIEHLAVYTVEEANKIENMLDGIGCKNLFLTDKKGHYYLYVLKDNKKADLKSLALYLKVLRLTFGSEEDLNNLLGLSKGSVTPLGIINDLKHEVVLIIDSDLVDKKLLCHPNVNTKTISIEYKDLIRLINNQGNRYIIYEEEN